MARSKVLLYAVFLLVFAVFAPLSFAQQTGTISGQVTTSEGEALPGVTVEASSSVLPQARVTTTAGNGDFRLPVLPPGDYTLVFSLEGMASQTRNTRVLLEQVSSVNATLGVAGVTETLTVTAEAPFTDSTSSEIKSALESEVIENLPVAQEYQDLVKLIPAVTYSEDAIRGPSAGGSGQDNTYNFDGVNVTLPLYGTLSAEPSTHDIDQFSVVKGGAKATDFNRSGGFAIDSVSKSGTNEFNGQLSYQIQSDSMVAEEDGISEFEEDKSWATISLGGPILKERLFFYGSYYLPEVTRKSRSNLYGEVPDLESTRDEWFGKLTFTPTSNILLHASYRDSKRTDKGTGVADSNRAGTSSDTDESTLKIGFAEGSWVVNSRSFATFKYTDFTNETGEVPDQLLDFNLATDGSVDLDINNLETQGLLVVPLPIAGQTNFNTFIAPIIERYGFLQNGVRTGGGRLGVASTFTRDDFFRKSAQVGYDFTLGQTLTHNVHVGYQQYTDEEELQRTSNGWGRIEVPGGRITFQGQPVFYQAIFEQQTLGESVVPVVRGEFSSKNIEINDSLQWNDWSFNVGIVASQDTWYGTGLREDSSTLSGYVRDPGNKYKMYEVPFEKMIQPRLGATWAYNGVDSVYANYARYHPAASSLPRAASWDRNLQREIQANFDQNGNLIGVSPLVASSGKLFVEDLDPRVTNEYLIGTSQQITDRLSARVYARHRYSTNFWEDTNNTARIAFNPPEGVPRELYIANLAQQLAQIGSGSTYVIAELDGAFTKYYELSTEAEWRSDKVFLRGSYTLSHYYGNFDQDNTTTANDASTFIGSSFLADGAGRQIWDRRYGDLRGDRPHLLKLYGYYTLPWRATAGAFGLYQSGEPWEAWNVEVYRGLTTSLDDTSRFAEPAGSRRTEDHYQIDLNYTQNFPIAGFNIQGIIDVYNLTNNQTGYAIQNKVNTANFGTPRSFYDPRRFQVALRFQF